MGFSLPHAHAQGVKQSVCPSVVVVVVGMKITMHILPFRHLCVLYKHNQSIDTGEKLFIRASNCSNRLTCATNRAFSVQHTCGLYRPHPLY